MRPECEQALEAIHKLTAGLAAGGGHPLRDAHAIYSAATTAQAWDHEECSPVAALGAEFLQLGEALEEGQDKPYLRERYEDLIRRAARAVEADEPLPDWTMPHRGVPDADSDAPSALPSIAEVRRLDPEAEILDLNEWRVLDVTDVNPRPLQPLLIVAFPGGCLVRADGETDWWMGQADHQDRVVTCWGTYGPDLRRAFDAL